MTLVTGIEADKKWEVLAKINYILQSRAAQKTPKESEPLFIWTIDEPAKEKLPTYMRKPLNPA